MRQVVLRQAAMRSAETSPLDVLPHGTTAAAQPAARVAVIIPTFNEAESIGSVVAELPHAP